MIKLSSWRTRRVRVRGYTLCPLLFLLLASSAMADPTLFMSGGGIAQLSGLWTADPATGAETYVAAMVSPGMGSIGLYAGGLAYDPVGERLFASGTTDAGQPSLFQIDRVSGEATLIGALGGDIGSGSGGLSYDTLAGRLYIVAQGPSLLQHSGLFELNVNSGAATLIGITAQAGTYLYGLGYDAATGTMYAQGSSNFLASGSQLYRIDTATGLDTVVGSHGISAGRQLHYSGIAFHPDTHVAYSMGSISASQSGLYTVNLSTGAATAVGTFTTNFGVDGGIVFVEETAVGAPGAERASLPGLVAWPNPYRGGTLQARFALDASPEVTLSVFDVRGRRIATIFDGPAGGGEQNASWGGRDQDGRSLSAGVYFLILDAGPTRLASTRVVLLR